MASSAAVAEALATLATVFPLRRDALANRDAWLRTWERALTHVDDDLLDRAVQAFIARPAKTDRAEVWFPRPDQIRTLARKLGVTAPDGTDLASRLRAWALAGGVDERGRPVPCPACGSIFAFQPARQGGKPRWRCLHDRDQHRHQGVPLIGEAA